MSDPNIIKIRCSAAYKDGTYLFGNEESDEPLVTDTLFKETPSSSKIGYKVVELRIMVPKDRAEQLVNGMRSGVVQLYIENMKSEVSVGLR